MIGSRVALSLAAENIEQGDVIIAVEHQPRQAAVTGQPRRDGLWWLVPTANRVVPLAPAARVTVTRRASGNAR
ncbi:hypothetical protein [Frankia sp. AgB32]|uniref:hypothetical protein n=1 Tax=Frankia sp. AgB32 TaxID=631119 RepID=UPI00200BF982|nr:hypothetical protein [Frankia sp. AgB32]MCK9894728.1 hypothetical protein [Frankia sp. AgB32]